MPTLRLVWLAGVPWSLRGLDWREVDGSARCVFRPLGPTGLWAHGRYTCSVLGSWCLARFRLFLLVFFFSCMGDSIKCYNEIQETVGCATLSVRGR